MKKLFFSTIITLFCSCAIAQEIAQGAWRTHFSYQNARIIQSTETKLFCAVQNGLFYIDLQENTVSTISKIDGLSDVGVSALGYSPTQNTLVIGYSNGNIDLLSDEGITNIDLVLTQNLVQDKTIKDISIKGDIAYLSTDFGIVVLDLDREVIDEVYREIGPDGQQPEVFASAVVGDSLFAITSLGFLGAQIAENINLLDFNNWHLKETPALIDLFQTIAASSNQLFLADQENIYSYAKGTFELIADQFNEIQLLTIEEGSNLFIINGGIGYQFQDNIFSEIANESSSSLQDIYLTGNMLWLADQQFGLKRFSSGNFELLTPNGPSSDDIQELVFEDDKIYAFGPYRNSNFTPLAKTNYSVFQNARWSDIEISGFPNVSDINGKYLASFSSGLYDLDNEEVISDTPLTVDNLSGSTLVPDIKIGVQGLWVSNYNTNTPLHLLNNEGAWQSFDLDGRAEEIVQFAVSRNIWIRDNNNSGITMYSPETDEVTVINTANSELPSSSINDISIDLDDEVWVATDKGIAFFPSASTEISNFNNAILPVFENNLLFRDEVINSITIDPGNRKWVGNMTGAWLLEESGESLVRRFTTENSPLPSNQVLHIAINAANGEVFFVTDKGMISFRSDATESTAIHGNVKIFPNPVRPNFTGLVGINGLATDVRIKITDVSGKLIRELEANGGAASWNMLDINGSRAQTGVYLLFSSDREGMETYIGKLAIIN